MGWLVAIRKRVDPRGFWYARWGWVIDGMGGLEGWSDKEKGAFHFPTKQEAEERIADPHALDEGWLGNSIGDVKDEWDFMLLDRRSVYEKLGGGVHLREAW